MKWVEAKTLQLPTALYLNIWFRYELPIKVISDNGEHYPQVNDLGKACYKTFQRKIINENLPSWDEKLWSSYLDLLKSYCCLSSRHHARFASQPSHIYGGNNVCLIYHHQKLLSDRAGVTVHCGRILWINDKHERLEACAWCAMYRTWGGVSPLRPSLPLSAFDHVRSCFPRIFDQTQSLHEFLSQPPTMCTLDCYIHW